MTTTLAKPMNLIDATEAGRAITLLLPPGQITELRALEAVLQGDRRTVTATGYFDDPAELLAALKTITSAKGIYIIPNPVNEALLARALNRIRPANKGESTSDNDILCRRWLKLDCDYKRPAGICSTNAEHDAALATVRRAVEFLIDRGWPEPIVADSGNGGHAMFYVDLPTDDDGLVQGCLSALAARFDDDKVKVDTTVFNPARIWRFYGCRNCKGDNTADRPHRMARILSAPDELAVVPTELLEALAAEPPKPAITTDAKPVNGHSGGFDLDTFIARNLPDAKGPTAWKGNGRLWELPQSPLCDHHDRQVYVGQFPSGAITAGCHHNSCSWNWHDLREKLEPRASRNGDHRHNGQAKSKSHHAAADHDAPNLWVPKFIMADQVIPRKREWLWPNKLVSGGLNLLAGMPDQGKSLLMKDITSRVTRGAPWPDCEASARLGGVVILSQEDDLETTVRPRLDAAGADCSRVALLQGVRLEGEEDCRERLIALDTDIALIEKTISMVPDCRLVCIDPISAYMGSADDHKNAAVRGVLANLADMAARCNVAVLMLSHLRKGEDKHVANRVMGSLAYVAVSRMVWLATWHSTADEDNEPKQRRICVLVKGNLTAQRTGLEYDVTTNNSTHDEPHIEWSSEPIDLDADEALEESGKSKRGPKPHERDKVVQWLRSKLAGGRRKAVELYTEAEQDGISSSTLKRAKTFLLIEPYRDANRGPWWWQLPHPKTSGGDAGATVNGGVTLDEWAAGWQKPEDQVPEDQLHRHELLGPLGLLDTEDQETQVDQEHQETQEDQVVVVEREMIALPNEHNDDR